MNLASRLEAARGVPISDAAVPSAPSAGSAAVPAPRPAVGAGGAGAQPPPTDALARLKDRVGKALFERMGARMNDPSLSEDALRTLVLGELDEVVEEENVPLSTEERQRLTAELADDVLGYGPLQRLLDDSAVSEIMVNGPDAIYVERSGILERTTTRFTSEEHLRRVIDRIVSRVGRRIDESSPLVDARLADGSRVNAIIPPLAVRGPSLTIRKFRRDPFTMADLERELLRDLGLDARADRTAVLDIEEAWAELAHEREVNPVLQLRERVWRAAVPVAVGRLDRRSDRRVRDPLVQLHRQLAFRSSSRRRPLSLTAGATGIGAAR